ncbi:hypothetical protein PVAR5_7470 [Paecilomyces variotii No. 5]|uniref:Uncharacterized protein n=1 Tax=Byssochlamys spectabilis (strain No. 5 / NBRC 109023) TaxID=1356009 RepID=V5FLD9_BYSSN|nr:hypothetical protein PVAR5_7470 [Paecilomyces variotii No. 5]
MGSDKRYTVTITANGETETCLYNHNTRSFVGCNLLPRRCDESTVSQRHPFWVFGVFLVVILAWGVTVRNSTKSKDSEKMFTKWLTPYIKTRAHLNKAIFLHVLLFPVLLVEGYWVLGDMWEWFQRYWTWELQDGEWLKQCQRFAMEVYLLLFQLPAVLLAGFYLMVMWIGCLGDFLGDWKFGEAVEESQPSKPSELSGPSTEKTDHTE